MKLLLAYDGFEHSNAAVEAVAALARGDGAEVTILSVVPPDARGSWSGGHVGLRPHAHEDVARAFSYLEERGVAARIKTAQGDPAGAILAEVEEGGYDVLVTGTHGRGTVGKILLGSVSSELARRATVPVLVAAGHA